MALSWLKLPRALKAAIGIGKLTLGGAPARIGRARRHRPIRFLFGLERPGAPQSPAPAERLSFARLRAPPPSRAYGRFSKCRAVRTRGDKIFERVPEGLAVPEF